MAAEGLLFLRSSFLSRQGEPVWFESGSGTERVAMPVFVEGNHAFSPLKASFGGFQYQGIPDLVKVRHVLENALDWMEKKRMSSFVLGLPPDAYTPEFHLKLMPLLVSLGFHLQWQDLNFHLDIDRPFSQHLSKSARWKRNKALREGYRFCFMPEPDWDQAYSFLMESRVRKGYALSMSREGLEFAFKENPDLFRMAGVFKSGICAALSVSIRVSDEIEYVFYTADSLEHRKRSPVILLHEGLYSAAGFDGVKLLDLGTASLKGLVNNGVATFKRGLGGVGSLKSTLVRKFR
jgi:hypothetical protein